MICAGAFGGSGQRFNVGTNALRISITHEIRCDFDSFSGFKILEEDVRLHFRVELLLIKNLEQHNVLALPGERPDTVQQLVDVAIKIRNHGDEAAAIDLLAKLVKRFVETGASGRCRRVEAMQYTLHFARSRWSLGGLGVEACVHP